MRAARRWLVAAWLQVASSCASGDCLELLSCCCCARARLSLSLSLASIEFKHEIGVLNEHKPSLLERVPLLWWRTNAPCALFPTRAASPSIAAKCSLKANYLRARCAECKGTNERANERTNRTEKRTKRARKRPKHQRRTTKSSTN